MDGFTLLLINSGSPFEGLGASKRRGVLAYVFAVAFQSKAHCHCSVNGKMNDERFFTLFSKCYWEVRELGALCSLGAQSCKGLWSDYSSPFPLLLWSPPHAFSYSSHVPFSISLCFPNAQKKEEQ